MNVVGIACDIKETIKLRGRLYRRTPIRPDGLWYWTLDHKSLSMSTKFYFKKS